MSALLFFAGELIEEFRFGSGDESAIAVGIDEGNGDLKCEIGELDTSRSKHAWTFQSAAASERLALPEGKSQSGVLGEPCPTSRRKLH